MNQTNTHMTREDLNRLQTEERNPRTTQIDQMDTLSMVQTICRENYAVEDAVSKESLHIAKAIDLIAMAFQSGGHLIYVGAGTSGRLGVVDASECPPTFGVDEMMVRAIIAGGKEAMFHSVEGAEDDEKLGQTDLMADGVTSTDVVVGLSASGGAPYVLGAIKKAREIGAKTIGITCNPQSTLEAYCDVTIAPFVGPEVIAGSSRLKAGTAQKLVLNLLSTGAMIKTGKVIGNLMVNVKPTNVKLKDRCIRILMELGGVDREKAEQLIDEYGEIRDALKSIRGDD